MSEQYRVEIKASAWRASGRIGEWVNREGTTRRFATKALARQWARSCAGPGVRIWVQDAPSHAEGPADGYVVGYRPDGERATHEGGEQASLAEE